jgi:tetratricopeptide (TPR) repeat protein
MYRYSFWYFFILFLPLKASSGLVQQANNLYENGKLTEAIGLYKKASLSGENPAICYFNLGNAYFQLDSIPQSIVYYQATVSLAPDFFRGHLNLAISYYNLDDLGRSIASVKRALEIEPENEKALLLLGTCYRRLKAYSEAVIIFEQLILLNPQRDEPYIAIAEIYKDLLDNDEALKWLSKCPETATNEIYINLLKAEIYEASQDLEKALFYLSTAFNKKRNDRWLLYRIVSLYLDMGKDLMALQQAAIGLEQFPDFAELAVLAGEICFKNQKYEESKRFFTIAKMNGSALGERGLQNLREIQFCTTEQASP